MSAVAMQEEVIVSHGFLDELNEEKHLRAVHYQMHAQLKCLHRIEAGV